MASGLILSIALTHDRRKGGDTRSVLHFSYVDGPDTFAQLVDTAEAMVVAEPIGKELVLASLDGGIEIAGQPFLIVSSVKGS